MNYNEFFTKATGIDKGPFDYQRRLAEERELPQLLDIPTGCGKTAAVVLAWLWRRRYASEEVQNKTPRRLVYCLPMRVLVEQTRDNCIEWLDKRGLLGGKIDDNGYEPSWDDPTKINVTVLMGGEDQDEWDLYPERDAIIIGTQDMLLSRALNRGYGMSRYRWPVHFGLLNNDCLWVMDEVQLMGVGVETTAQMDAFRRKLGTYGTCSSIWMSATMDEDRLDTVDATGDHEPLNLGEADRSSEVVGKRLKAEKKLECFSRNLYNDNVDEYPEILSERILEEHQIGSMTLVIVNTVARAQDIFKELQKKNNDHELLLLHSRYRKGKRDEIISKLLKGGDLIVVSTQVVEAGVDISARVMFSELAPWPSMVQRFGRCNRKGEYQDSSIIWIDMDGLSAPYSEDEMDESRKKLDELNNASIVELSKIESPVDDKIYPVIRKKDLMEIFDTTPDLSGNDLDISRYIREGDERDVQVYWREIPEGGPQKNMARPHRDELCRAPIGDARKFFGKKTTSGWVWDHLDEAWKPVDKNYFLRPGEVILAGSDAGGYSEILGWIGGKAKKTPVEPVPIMDCGEIESMNSDAETTSGRWVPLKEHCSDVSRDVKVSASRLGLDTNIVDALGTAGYWHDVGKGHEAFQSWLHTGKCPDEKTLWAKSAERLSRPRYEVNGISRKYFRHELASALAWYPNKDESENGNLIAYLIASHHGKVRQSIRSLPDETEPLDERLFARGIWNGDRLRWTPDGPVELDLSPMMLGEGSWLEMSLAVLEKFGPFKLGFLEALLRVSDWTVSASYEEVGP